jgi:hypothetical protein
MEGVNMKKRFLPIVLLAALSLTACGINKAEAKPAEEPAIAETPAAEARPTELAPEAEIPESENANTDNEAPEEAYADYYKMIGDMKAGLEKGLEEPVLNGFALADVYMMIGDNDIPGYIIKDLNGDGIDELIFGMNLKEVAEDDNWDGIVYDVFTMVDGKMTQVVDGWARNRYYICENGAIANEGSGGAAYSCYTYYDFDGKELKVRESYFTGYRDEAQTDWGWFFSDTEAWADDAKEVSEEEARQAIAAYTYDKQKYIPFAEYNG